MKRHHTPSLADLAGCAPIAVGFGIGALICLMISLCGCSQRIVEVERPVIVEHTTTERHTELRVDTIYNRDSTFVYLQGDTLIERHYNTIYKVQRVNVADTIRDTIPRIVTVTETQVREVKRPLRWWQQALMWLGGIAATLTTTALAWLLWRIRH